jgi:transcriptional regulator with XRE-family HTH domain
MAAKRQRLVQRRQLVGFSQEALASALLVERSTVVRWESGDTKPQPWLRSRLAQALRVSLDELDELLTAERDGNAGAGPAAEPTERAVRPPTAQVAEKRSPADGSWCPPTTPPRRAKSSRCCRARASRRSWSPAAMSWPARPAPSWSRSNR